MEELCGLLCCMAVQISQRRRGFGSQLPFVSLCLPTLQHGQVLKPTAWRTFRYFRLVATFSTNPFRRLVSQTTLNPTWFTTRSTPSINPQHLLFRLALFPYIFASSLVRWIVFDGLPPPRLLLTKQAISPRMLLHLRTFLPHNLLGSCLKRCLG